MAVTCHLRNPKTFAEQKAGLGSEEKNWGEVMVSVHLLHIL